MDSARIIDDSHNLYSKPSKLVFIYDDDDDDDDDDNKNAKPTY
jgi:hypothetical protein